MGVLGCVSCLRKNITKPRAFKLDLNDPPEEYIEIDSPYISMPLNQKIKYINMFLRSFPAKQCWLVELSLSSCGITANEAEDLGNVILLSPQIHTIDLSSNCLTDTAQVSTYLLPALCGLKNLKKLILKDNQLGLMSFTYLAKHIQNSLEILRLENNVLQPPLVPADPGRIANCVTQMVLRTPLLRVLYADEIHSVASLCYLECLDVKRLSNECVESTQVLPSIKYLFVNGRSVRADDPRAKRFYEARGDIVKWMLQLRRAGMSKDAIEFLLTF